MTDAGVFAIMLGTAVALALAPARFAGYRILSSALFFGLSLVMFSGDPIASVQHVATGNVTQTVTAGNATQTVAIGNATQTVTTQFLAHDDISPIILGYTFFFAGLLAALTYVGSSLTHVAGFVRARREGGL